MKKTIGELLIALSKTKIFRSFVIGLLIRYPKLMDCVVAATEIYKNVKDLTESDK